MEDLDGDAGHVADRIRTDPVDGDESLADGAQLDEAGEPFDPKIHTGTKSPAGFWRRKKGHGRERRDAGDVAGAEIPTAAGDGAPAAPDYRALASLTVVNLTAGLALVFGAHWRTDEGDEQEAMTAAWAAYFQARGVSDVPPEWMLVAVMGAYTVPRLCHPTTKSILGRARDALRRGWRWIRRRGWRDVGARVDFGPDGHRENDAGEEPGAPISPARGGGAGLVPAAARVQ